MTIGEAGQQMDVYEAIYTTRAMRRVKPDPIPEDVVRKLFDAAVRGPSGGNEQRFRFMTVTDPGMKAKIQPIYRACLDELNATQYAGVETSTSAQTKRIYGSSQHMADHLHEHPMLIFAFGKDRGESTTFPCLWNLCLAARAEGLGTCVTTLLKIRREEVESLLGVPDDGHWVMHAMIPIGYPTGRWGVASRRPAHEAVFAETWGEPVSWEVEEPLWP